jgi:hypothetical protein
MPTLLDKLKIELAKKQIPLRSAASRQWLARKAKSLTGARNSLLRDRNRMTGLPQVGQMYFFVYDPKLKKTLPFYDTFPLVLPIEYYDDGFLGLNLHYVDPGTRAAILDVLMDYTNNKKYNETTRLKLSYQMLSSISRAAQIEPCIKRYLFDHVRSEFIGVEPSEWEMAIFLPAERFVKASSQSVWQKSRNR